MKFLLFLTFASFLFDASAQRMEDGVSYPLENMEGSGTLYSKKTGTNAVPAGVFPAL
jgi:hypothetical protein